MKGEESAAKRARVELEPVAQVINGNSLAGWPQKFILSKKAKDAQTRGLLLMPEAAKVSWQWHCFRRIEKAVPKAAAAAADASEV